MDIHSVNSAAAALVAGCVTSVHCAGMCGPLACAVMPAGRGAGGGRVQLASTLYHLARIASYTLLGAAAGMIGQAPLAFLADSPVSLLPWALAAAFLIVALGLEARMPRPAIASRFLMALRSRTASLRGARGALLLGAGTPLLPCGPLYLMLGIALVSGSALRGAEFCLAFGLGTVPLLWLAQTQFGAWQRRLGAPALRRVQRGGALLAAVVLVWRLRGTLWFVDGAAGGCH